MARRHRVGRDHLVAPVQQVFDDDGQRRIDGPGVLLEAELAVEQETRRVLRSLSEDVADAADALETGLKALTEIDLAFARARLSLALDAVEPCVENEGVIHLPLLRHPLIPVDEAVPNDLHLGDDFLALILSGPNAGGKTVTRKALAVAVLSVRACLFE